MTSNVDQLLKNQQALFDASASLLSFTLQKNYSSFVLLNKNTNNLVHSCLKEHRESYYHFYLYIINSNVMQPRGRSNCMTVHVYDSNQVASLILQYQAKLSVNAGLENRLENRFHNRQKSTPVPQKCLNFLLKFYEKTITCIVCVYVLKLFQYYALRSSYDTMEMEYMYVI